MRACHFKNTGFVKGLARGSGVAVYSAYAGNWDGAFIEERSEIRTRLEAEMAAAIKPR